MNLPMNYCYEPHSEISFLIQFVLPFVCPVSFFVEERVLCFYFIQDKEVEILSSPTCPLLHFPSWRKLLRYMPYLVSTLFKMTWNNFWGLLTEVKIPLTSMWLFFRWHLLMTFFLTLSPCSLVVVKFTCWFSFIFHWMKFVLEWRVYLKPFFFWMDCTWIKLAPLCWYVIKFSTIIYLWMWPSLNLIIMYSFLNFSLLLCKNNYNWYFRF